VRDTGPSGADVCVCVCVYMYVCMYYTSFHVFICTCIDKHAAGLAHRREMLQRARVTCLLPRTVITSFSMHVHIITDTCH
jgi:hypothetical protein